jgi:hypothetical protein
MNTHSPDKPKEFIQLMSARKLMVTVFWDRKGILMVEFMQQGTTITSQVYCETLKIVRRAIQNKMRGMLTHGVVLFRDNARPHTAARTRVLLEHLNWELFDNPHDSPHLAMSDYHLFNCPKNSLGSQRFNKDARCQNVAELTGGMQTSLMRAYKNLFPDTTSVSILVVTTLRSSLSMYVFLVYDNFFSLLVLLTARREVTFRIALLYNSVFYTC